MAKLELVVRWDVQAFEADRDEYRTVTNVSVVGAHDHYTVTFQDFDPTTGALFVTDTRQFAPFFSNLADLLEAANLISYTVTL